MFKYSKKYLAWLIITGYCCLSGFIYSCGTQKDEPEEAFADQKDIGDYRVDEYVGSSSCAECHAESTRNGRNLIIIMPWNCLGRKLYEQILIILNL